MFIRELGVFDTGKIPPKTKGNVPIYGGNGIMGFTDKANVEENTIIIGRVGVQCGNVKIAKQKVFVSDNALTFVVNKEFNPVYVYYILSAIDLNEYHTGSSQPLITQSIVGSLEIKNIPSIDNQNKIAKILSSIDEQIERNNVMIQKIPFFNTTKYSVEIIGGNRYES